MKSIKNISAIGLGAIGCAYTSKLYDFNPEGIKFIAGEERAERYKKSGFIINGKKYNFTYIDPKEKMPASRFDYCLCKVKSINSGYLRYEKPCRRKYYHNFSHEWHY